MQIVDYKDPDAPRLFVESLRQTGFGVLKNHPIEQDLVNDIYNQWQAFFDGQDKYNYLFDEELQDGLFPLETSETAKGHQVRDLKEFYHIYPAGRVPEYLKEKITEYYQRTSEFAAELLGWIEKYSPPEVAANYSEALSHMIKDTPNTLLRVLHYPPLKGNEEQGAVRAASHEDINLITILPAANASGLQVKNKDGSWMDVPSNFGNLIINIGDMLQEASNGYFPSTSHRVINPSGGEATKSRISLPLFLHPRSEVKLSERHTQASYLLERLRELGIKS